MWQRTKRGKLLFYLTHATAIGLIAQFQNNIKKVCFVNGCGQIAQSVEQRTENPCVGGSIPPLATNPFFDISSVPNSPRRRLTAIRVSRDSSAPRTSRLTRMA